MSQTMKLELLVAENLYDRLRSASQVEGGSIDSIVEEALLDRTKAYANGEFDEEVARIYQEIVAQHESVFRRLADS